MRLGNLIGRTFGCLTVVGQADDERNGATRWDCRCVCGRTVTVRGSNLTSGAVLSCGCYRRARSAERLRARHAADKKEAMAMATSPCNRYNLHDFTTWNGPDLVSGIRSLRTQLAEEKDELVAAFLTLQYEAAREELRKRIAEELAKRMS